GDDDARYKARFGPAVTRLDQLDFALATAAVIGTSTTPRLCAAFAHFTMRSIDTGRAPAVPTAVPRASPIASNRASARSMTAGDGTASSTTSALANARLLAPAIWLARLRGELPSST